MAVLLAVPVFFGGAPAVAGGSHEAETHGSLARLIQSPLVQPNVLEAAAARLGVPHDPSSQVLVGLQVDLASGWKTYWRMPGDAGGVAPEFGFGRSDNIASAVVGLPAPLRLKGDEGQNIGYKGEVVFPVLVTLADPTRPAVVRLDLFYGLCREICIPAQVQLELPIAGAGSGLAARGAGSSLESARFAGLLAEAVEALPIRFAKGDTEASPRSNGARLPRLVSASLDREQDVTEAVFDVAFPEMSARNDLFVEPPAGLYLSMTRKMERVRGGQEQAKKASGGEDERLVRFKLALPADEADLDELLSSHLRITMVAASGSVERTVKLAAD